MFEHFKKLKDVSDQKLRGFGLSIGGTCVLLCVWLNASGVRWMWLAVLAALLIAAGVIKPRMAKWLYVAWMATGLFIGMMVSTILLTILFYLVVTPMAFIARLTGKDFLNSRFETESDSYWVPRNSKQKPTAQYERQF